MKTINLITPKGSILITSELIDKLSDKAGKILKQALKYLEAESLLDEIKVAIDYLDSKNHTVEHFQLRLLESGIITTYALIFTDGLNLSPKKIFSGKQRGFHSWLMELRNNYYCHSNLYISTAFNQIIKGRDKIFITASYTNRIRPLDNKSIPLFKSHIQDMENIIKKCLYEAELSFMKNISESDVAVLEEFTGKDDNEKLRIVRDQHTKLSFDWMRKKP